MGDIIEVAGMLSLALSSVALTMTGYERKNNIMAFAGRISAIIFIILFAILFIRMMVVKLQFFEIIDPSACFCISKHFPYFRIV